MADARNFLLNSDYPVDKIVYKTEDSASVPANTDDNVSAGITIAHGLPFTPLPELIWSNSSDFSVTSNTWDETYAVSSGGGAMPPDGQYYTITADDTNLYIFRYNWGVGAKTLYYRIFCFMPSTASEDSDIDGTANNASNFILDTDNNYMKVAATGRLVSGGTESYSHGLGFVPRVRYWTETSGTIGWRVTNQLIESDPTGTTSTTGLIIDSTDLTWLNPNSFDYLHYRLYADG